MLTITEHFLTITQLIPDHQALKSIFVGSICTDASDVPDVMSYD